MHSRPDEHRLFCIKRALDKHSPVPQIALRYRRSSLAGADKAYKVDWLGVQSRLSKLQQL